jgi:hypothetical protein
VDRGPLVKEQATRQQGPIHLQDVPPVCPLLLPLPLSLSSFSLDDDTQAHIPIFLPSSLLFLLPFVISTQRRLCRHRPPKHRIDRVLYLPTSPPTYLPTYLPTHLPFFGPRPTDRPAERTNAPLSHLFPSLSTLKKPAGFVSFRFVHPPLSFFLSYELSRYPYRARICTKTRWSLNTDSPD